MEAWDNDEQSLNDEIDDFVFPLSSLLDNLNVYNSLTRQGHHGIGNLTLNLTYGKLTNDTSSCNSVVQITSSNPVHVVQPSSSTSVVQATSRNFILQPTSGNLVVQLLKFQQ